jgi:NAD(P)-dependent dehydrogenase (short-subunit alcohol dehydrogenase family)
VTFVGQAVVITGVADAGQAGASVARAFAEHGAVVHCIGRRAEVAERVREMRKVGLDAYAHQVDLTEFNAVSELARQIAAMHDGRISAVAALAGGFFSSGPIADSDPRVYERMIAVNLTTAYATARAFAPAVRAGRGAFVFVSSAAALQGGKTKGLSAYAASKGALIQLVRALAEEEREHGVRANVLAPTAIRTAENEASMGPDARYVERDTFAETLVALCSPALKAVSAQLIELR